MQSYEFYWESGIFSEQVNKVLFHFLVNVAVSGESLTALFVAGQYSDKVPVVDFLIDIADECASCKVTAGNLVDWSLFLVARCRIVYNHHPDNAPRGKIFRVNIT